MKLRAPVVIAGAAALNATRVRLASCAKGPSGVKEPKIQIANRLRGVQCRKGKMLQSMAYIRPADMRMTVLTIVVRTKAIRIRDRLCSAVFTSCPEAGRSEMDTTSLGESHRSGVGEALWLRPTEKERGHGQRYANNGA